ncbi:MAG: hypothetical protein MK081_00435 [Flavobacteriales bacterium]|uniref:hypothetical protein n=1 Tax=Sanyastnella coralliicola TaxID=3069118 RepID=UPI0027BA53F6|nr:hypothetical protein [Longitalea sp. SCSIO 12813]MCH2197221.1 hypothetical protein [Flavobacteriales bacterium]
MRTALFLLCAGIFLVSCEKQPGEGGGASIKGTIMKEVRVVLSNPGSVVATYPAADEDVFVIFGDNLSPDERVLTSYDGQFEFQFLRRGNYTIYVYSGDTTGQVGVDQNRMPIIREVEITERREEIDLGEIWIYDEN